MAKLGLTAKQFEALDHVNTEIGYSGLVEALRNGSIRPTDIPACFAEERETVKEIVRTLKDLERTAKKVEKALDKAYGKALDAREEN